MRVVVCIKHVPDPLEPRRLRPETLTMVREGLQGVSGYWDDYALEQALLWKDEMPDLEIIALTMGPDDATDTLKKALAKGASRGILIGDPALAGSDLLGTGRTLGAAIKQLGEVDLVLMGLRSLDGGTAMLGSVLAEVLQWPLIARGQQASLKPSERTVQVERESQVLVERLSCAWPAVLTIGRLAQSPRLPSFRGIMATSKKPVETWSLADLGMTREEVGGRAARARITATTPAPARTLHVLEGSAQLLAQQLALLLRTEGGR